MRINGQVQKPESTSARKQRASMMGQGSAADITSGPAGLAPRQQAEGMTAPETFTSLKSTLDPGAPSRHELDGAVCDGGGRGGRNSTIRIIVSGSAAMVSIRLGLTTESTRVYI